MGNRVKLLASRPSLIQVRRRTKAVGGTAQIIISLSLSLSLSLGKETYVYGTQFTNY